MNEEEIIKFWKFLGHEKQTELRAIIPQVETHNYHFSTQEQLIQLCKRYNGTHNIYLGVNERCENGTTAEDVIKVKIIPLDIDCVKKPATDEDIMEANMITMQILEDAEKQGFKKPFVSFSGNGYQLYFKIPAIDITKDNLQEISDKIKEFERRMIEKYSNDKVKLDNVGDLPRIMRVAGTFNIKSKTHSIMIYCPPDGEDDALLREYILDLKLTSDIIVGGLSEEIKEKIKNDENVQKLMAGELLDKKSRSEAELSLVCRLVQLGLDKEQIFRTMASCKLGKWQEANVGYRELTYRKAIELITTERLKQSTNPTLQDLYLVYKKWLYIEDTKRIDIVLATYLTQYLEGTPIWLLLVGNSGDGKTEQIMALEECENFKILHKFTARTLVSGMKDVPDLAPELNGQVVVIPDMAQILQLSPQDKAEVWAQLRDLYDGFAGVASGTGKRASYKDLRVTLMGCSTPKIDSQILVHQDLGTREMIYRTEDIENEFELMRMAMSNESQEKKMKRELRDITKNFMKDKRVVLRELTAEEVLELENLALFIAQSRATAEYDSYTDELRNFVYPERPTRVIKQLKRIYLALLSLEENYATGRAFTILWHLAKSCAFPIRISIFEHFIREFINDSQTRVYSTSKIANTLLIGKRTAKRELSILWNMGILKKTEVEEGNRWQTTEYWELNISNKFIESYLKFIKQDVKTKMEVLKVRLNSSGVV
jgi:hypothetical protein